MPDKVTMQAFIISNSELHRWRILVGAPTCTTAWTATYTILHYSDDAVQSAKLRGIQFDAILVHSYAIRGPVALTTFSLPRE